MAIANWWGFLIFFGGIGLIVIIAILLERKSKSDSILELKPARVVANIILVQLCFEIIYPLVIFSLDLIWFEPFHPSQVWTSKESLFFTQRGLITFFGSIIAFASLFLPLTAIVQNSKNMPDYIFTVFFWHFIIVCFVGWEFPSDGAWWVSCALGFILSVISSEFVCNKLELMSYESALGGRSKSEELEESKLNSEQSVSTSPIHIPTEQTVHHRNNYDINRRSYSDDITTVPHIKHSPKSMRRSRSRENPRIPKRASSNRDTRDLSASNSERKFRDPPRSHSSRSNRSRASVERKGNGESSSHRGSNDGRKPRKSYSSDTVSVNSKHKSSDEAERSRSKRAKRRSVSENDIDSNDSSSDHSSSSKQRRLSSRDSKPKSKQQQQQNDTKV